MSLLLPAVIAGDRRRRHIGTAPPTVTGTFATTLAPAVVAVTGGGTGVAGSFGSTLAPATTALAGFEEYVGTFATTLADSAVSIIDVGNVSGTFATTLDLATVALVGTSSSAGTLPSVAARQSEEFVAHCGVGTHWNFTTAVYGVRGGQAVADYILSMGFRKVRTNYSQNVSNFINMTNNLAAGGCVTHGTCGVTADGTSSGNADSVHTAIKNSIINDFGGESGGIITELEGVNEPNNDAGIAASVWVPRTRTMQTSLWNTMKGDTRTDGIPICAPGLARVSSTLTDYKAIGDYTGICDYGTMHIYPRGVSPSADIDTFSGYAAFPYGTHPLMTTEGGYSDDLLNTTLGNPVPQDIVAYYSPRHYLEQYTRNQTGATERNHFFKYEMSDDPLPASPPDKTRRESSFGYIATPTMTESTWSLKASGIAVKNMFTILGDRGATFTPTPLNMKVTTSGSGYRSCLLQKRDGVWYWCVWRDLDGWNTGTRTRITIADANVTVDLGTARPVTRFIPNDTATGTSLGTVASFTVAVGQKLVIARIG